MCTYRKIKQPTLAVMGYQLEVLARMSLKIDIVDGT